MSAHRPLTDLDYEQLSAYLDGALSDSERSSLETRLDSEPALRRELEALRQTVALMNGLPRLKAPRDFTLDASMVRARPSRLLIFPTTAAFSALSAAAAVLLLVLAGFLFLSQSSANLLQPQAVQQIAANPTAAVTNEAEAAQPAPVSPTPLPPPQAAPPMPTHVAPTLEAPQETLGLAAADEQSQEAESADSGAGAQPSSSTEPLAALPTTESPASGGFAADTAQGEFAFEEGVPTAPPPAPPATPPSDTTTFAFAPTDPQADVEDAAASSRAADNRLMIEQTATALSESLSVAQITATPARERDDDLSSASSPDMTSTPPPTPASLLDGLLERGQTGGKQNTLASILLAAGILLLIVAIATTLARRRQ